MGEFIALISFAVFVWAVVGLINPKAARLPNRITSVWIWLLSVALAGMGGSVALAGMGGSLMPDDPAEPASEEAAASAPASPTPPPPPRDTSLAPERSSRLAASVTRSCSCRPCPSLASAALFLPRQGLSAFDCSGPHEQLLDRVRCMEPCAPVVSPRLDGALLHEHRLRVERRRLLNRQD